MQQGIVDSSSTNPSVSFPVTYTTNYVPIFGYQSDNSNSPNFRHLGVYLLNSTNLSLDGFTVYGSSVLKRFWMTRGY